MLRIKRIGFALLLFGAVVLWFVLLRPGFLGGPASYVIVAGASMEPTLHGGDLAVMRQQEDYCPGDVIVFRAEGSMVIHRIVGGTREEGYVVQGDNKESPDPWRPTANDILGRMWFRVPRGGLYVLSLRQPIVLGAVAGLLGMLIVLSGDEGSQRARRPSSTIRRGAPVLPGWGVLVLGFLAVLAVCFAAVAVFTLRQPIETISETAHFSPFDLDIPMTTVRAVSAVGFALTGGAATGGLVLAMLLSRERGEADRIQAR